MTPANDAAPLDLRDSLRISLDMLGLPPTIAEPEVARATMDSLKCKSLAILIADLIAEHEPLLRAEVDGATVTVREIGDGGVMQFTVEAR